MEPTALAGRVKAITKQRAAISRRITVIERKTRALEHQLEALAKEQEAAGTRLQEIDALVKSIEELASRVTVGATAARRKQETTHESSALRRRTPADEQLATWATEHAGEQVTREQLANATGVAIAPVTLGRALERGVLVRVAPNRYRAAVPVAEAVA